MTKADRWKDRRECAEEVSAIRGEVVTVGRLIDWKRRNAMPLPDRGSIPKQPVLDWLAGPEAPRMRSPTEAPESNDETALRITLLEEQIRHLRAKNEVLEGTRLDAAAVTSAISAGNADLKREILSDLLVQLWSVCQDKTADLAIPEMRTVLEGAFARHLDRCKRCAAGTEDDDDPAG